MGHYDSCVEGIVSFIISVSEIASLPPSSSRRFFSASQLRTGVSLGGIDHCSSHAGSWEINFWE